MTLINKTDFGYKMSLGAALPSFSLPATDGKTYSESDFSKDVLVVVFSCNHCPYVKAIDESFPELVAKYKDRVDFVAINSNESENYPEDSFENMKRKKVNYAYLHDESQEVAKEFGAECTPHFFAFKDGKLVYQGRMNDAGQDASRASTHELADALDALLAGKEPSTPLTSAMGCSIKWK